VLRVEVAYALPGRQLLLALTVPEGTTAREAVERSGLAARVAGLDLASVELGLFGKVVPATQTLRDGDRIDVLRPLLADPKEVRRALAAQGRTMGKRPAKDEG
jgi:putative ubiquitin-RnfH superfamily antitoxin RatB of RatAB toxin-antitoxin module